MTVAEAFKFAALPGGGAILVVDGCVEANYDDTINCAGFQGTDPKHFNPSEKNIGFLVEEAATGLPTSKQYTCYANSSTKAFPINRMKNYMLTTVASGPPSDGQLWSV